MARVLADKPDDPISYLAKHLQGILDSRQDSVNSDNKGKEYYRYDI